MIDLSFLEKFTKGNTQKMKRYISIYLDLAPALLEKMEQNIADQDWEQLRINAHSLKPQADFMGIPALNKVLKEIEERASRNNILGIDALCKSAIKIHTETAPLLEEAVKEVF